MTYELNCAGFEEYRIATEPLNGGIGHRFRFQNNYGASVVKHPFSYGYSQDLWELAVIRYFDEYGCWDLDYDTEITDDVEGYLSDNDVRDLLERIKNLDEPKEEEET